MNGGLAVDLVVSGIIYGTPLVLAALGELLGQRSGVLNLGVEGMMLMGAVSAFWVSQQLGGPEWICLLVAIGAAIVVGALMAAIHAFLTITLSANQIVSGLALTIFGGALGLSSYLGSVGGLNGTAGRHQMKPIDVFGLQDVPLVGPILFHQNAMVYASWALIVLVSLYLYRTRFGLHLRAVGEDPHAADVMGINVVKYRYVHTIVGGCFAGVAGATYSLAIAPHWSEGLTAGAGWIAVALVIFCFWRPTLVWAGAYLFGIVSSLGFTLQARDVQLAPEIFASLPYVLTVVVLVVVSSTWGRRRIGEPAALAEPYRRESE